MKIITPRNSAFAAVLVASTTGMTDEAAKSFTQVAEATPIVQNMIPEGASEKMGIDAQAGCGGRATMTNGKRFPVSLKASRRGGGSVVRVPAAKGGHPSLFTFHENCEEEARERIKKDYAGTGIKIKSLSISWGVWDSNRRYKYNFNNQTVNGRKVNSKGFLGRESIFGKSKRKSYQQRLDCAPGCS